MRYDPWTVLKVNLSPHVGHEQAGYRPAIVIGSRLGTQIGQRMGLVTVVPCSRTDRGFPWHPQITLDGDPGVAMCDQLKSVSVQRVAGLHAAKFLPVEQRPAVQQALRTVLGL
jgi:mRNA interferase MazF